VALLAAAGGLRFWGPAARADIPTHRVTYEDLEVTITERGSLESAENSDIICRVKARSPNSTVATTIRWVIDDGTQVKKGDRLVQLDDSGLHEQRKAQAITVEQAAAALEQAEQNLTIVRSQNKSDLATAELALELAEIDKKKYELGEYLQTREEIKGRISIAQTDLAMWQERAAWSERMSRPGLRFVTTAQAQADEARLRSAEIALQKVQEEMRVLERFTLERTLKDLNGKIAEARRAIERVDAQNKAKDATAQADRNAKRSIFEQERIRLNDIDEEIRKCLILAPQDGLVVYFVPEQSRFGSGSQQSIVAQGEPVREGQKLMRIPNLNKMVVATRIHEAMISRVRGEKLRRNGIGEAVTAGWLLACPLHNAAGLMYFDDLRESKKSLEYEQVAQGQRALVRVEAFPSRLLPAEVKTVATVASQQDWMSADVKVYQAMVAIHEAVPGLKPGMTAEVTIQTDSNRERVLTVPLQAILGSVDMGDKRRVYVMTDRGPEPRDVVIGMSNDVKAEVVSGLAEGELVVQDPRSVMSARDKAALGEARPPSDRGGKGKGKEKKKG
jgi:multidrug efflux pump subunit AcrA (membrane-fusion protein)